MSEECAEGEGLHPFPPQLDGRYPLTLPSELKAREAKPKAQTPFRIPSTAMAKTPEERIDRHRQPDAQDRPDRGQMGVGGMGRGG